MRGAQHFEQVAQTYSTARPPYPEALFTHLVQTNVIGTGRRVLEIGAGTGQASRELVDRGCILTAIEPGENLARHLGDLIPGVDIINTKAESAPLPAKRFDSVVAATSMHWLDLPAVLPRLHQALVPGGRLAVWRTIFGDPNIHTPFRTAVATIKHHQRKPGTAPDPIDPRPTQVELEAGGWFTHLETWTHRWSIDLSPDQISRLFATFSDWTPAELRALHAAAKHAGPRIREHYITHLNILIASNQHP